MILGLYYLVINLLILSLIPCTAAIFLLTSLDIYNVDKDDDINNNDEIDNNDDYNNNDNSNDDINNNNYNDVIL
ncbi:hypothetical protein RIR_jg4360.t1 [Rhizophagus irregularis DAOM 181602=DAOM 197198]|nr:hypothetical protein RIR_jg4360.t1 [Rhizophagus irregularis DAOM 181602=DAOM 197198]